MDTFLENILSGISQWVVEKEDKLSYILASQINGLYSGITEINNLIYNLNSTSIELNFRISVLEGYTVLRLNDGTIIKLTTDTLTERIISDNYKNTLIEIHVSNNVNTITVNTFANCTILEGITIGSGTTIISNQICYNCSKLSSIVVDSNNTVYDSRDNCNAIIETSTNKLVAGCNNTIIPDTVTSISDNAFIGSGIEAVVITSGVTSIGFGAFSGCVGLSSITVDVNNVVYDSRNNCNAIIISSTNELIVGCQNTIIPNTVTGIGLAAFMGCTMLKNINIPDSVTSINDSSFYGCNGLQSISIGSGLTSIGERAFYHCSSLSSITVDSNNAVYDSRDNCNAIIETSTNTLLYGSNNTIIPDTVTSISDNAFIGRSELSSIEIPNSIVNIGDGAFSGCVGLESVIIGNGLTELSSYAFADCSNNTLSITIPNTVITIGQNAFRGVNHIEYHGTATGAPWGANSMN